MYLSQFAKAQKITLVLPGHHLQFYRYVRKSRTFSITKSSRSHHWACAIRYSPSACHVKTNSSANPSSKPSAGVQHMYEYTR